MKKKLIYYTYVLIVFLGIISGVGYIINNTRQIIGYEDLIMPVNIYWRPYEEGLLRVKSPQFISTNYYVVELDKINNEDLKAELVIDSIYDEGNLLNLNPPYLIWKKANNDTINIYKNNYGLKFTNKY